MQPETDKGEDTVPISPYLAALRSKVGSELLLLPSVAVVVRDGEGRLLLVRDRDSDEWGLPAGGIEPTEAPIEAAHRELREETGVTSVELVLSAALGGARFRHTYPNGDRVEYAIFVYAGTVPSDEATGRTDVEEIADVRFFARKDAPSLSLPYPEKVLWGST